jgi:hypothetical protein
MMFLFQELLKTATRHILEAHIKLVIKLYQVVSFNNILVIEPTKKFNFLSE